MARKVEPIPESYHTLTAALTVSDAARAIAFYKEAFGAEERFRMTTPDGKYLVHAELTIGDSVFMLGEEMPGQDCHAPRELGGTSVGFYIYTEDVDRAFARAVAAGAETKMAVEDMFWGDRIGTVIDPSGHMWTLASHVEDVSPEEIDRRGREFAAKMMQQTGPT